MEAGNGAFGINCFFVSFKKKLSQNFSKNKLLKFGIWTYDFEIKFF